MADLILALDVPSREEALSILDRLPGLRWVKVGSVLMTREGPSLLRALKARGLQIFLDLKWHDIPNTVAGAVRAARDQGISLATVHTLGGPAMMDAAAEAAGDSLALVGVTILTSHDDSSLAAILGKPGVRVGEEVLRLSSLAKESGLKGVVCSPHEVAAVKDQWDPGGLFVVPGIRRPADAAGDQQRVADPASAVRAGATHLVVGRPILHAPDPDLALREIMSGMV
jgi:orotidine-5'-phosphate decarboxylase